MKILMRFLAMLLVVFGSGSAWSEETGEDAVGPVTGLKMPRFVSIKGDEANARRGPGLDHRIDWVFVRQHLPVRVVAEYEHWRRVEDFDGAGGWVHYALLSGKRSAIVHPGTLAMRYSPKTTDHAMATLTPGVIALIERCDGKWCKIRVGERLGWALQTGFWGVSNGEVID